jgi:microcystin synthetase protein McyA
LLRFTVHRRSADSFQFTMSCHHAILDGWSVATLFTELFQETFRLMGLGHTEAAVAPASGYHKFVALERETLASAAAQSYWQGQLSELTRTRLPREQQETEAVQPRLLDREVRLGGEVSAGLRKLARSAGVPLKSVLLAAHLRVLSVFSGQRDVLTGLVSNGRVEETDGERVLGCF